MKKLFLLLLMLPVLLFAKSTPLEKVSVRLLWLNQFEFAGYYTALERGYYKDAGLDVEIKEYEFGTDITQEVMQGKSDFGIESSSIVLEKMQGEDVFLLLAGYQKSPFVLMSKKREDIKKIEDLKDKKIMVTPNQVTMATLNAMLRINDVYPSDYVSTPHTFDTNDLVNNSVDAMSTYVSNEPYHLQKDGVEYTVFDPADYGFSFYSDILFTSKEFFQNNPKITDKFYEATLKGWQYSFENIDQTVDLIYQKYNTQNKSKEHLLFEANELKKRAYTDSGQFGVFEKDKIAQIAQTYQLLNLSKATIDFENFIYEKAIYKQKSIDYELIAKVGFVVLILFLGLYYWNRKLAKLNGTIEVKSQKITTLLNNSKQGFLTFNTDFIIDSEYSKECEKLLGKDLERQDISKILFTDLKQKEFFRHTTLCALKEKTPLSQNAILSLLPDLIILNKRALQIEYKIIDKFKIMLIITNISKQIKLEKRVKKEQEVLKMVVAVVSQSDTFYDIKNDFSNFSNSYEKMLDMNKSAKENIEIFYRIIHTFKGIFSQLYMSKTVEKLHEIESKLSECKADDKCDDAMLMRVLKNFDFQSLLHEDLSLIAEILGSEFAKEQRYVKIEYGDIMNLQEKIGKLASNEAYQSPECRDIVTKIQELSSYKCYDLLKPYESFTKELAKRLGKNVYDLQIQGDKNIILSHSYKPLIKSLIHIFRNALDHGIEDEEKRFMKQKDEFGKICCNYEVENGKLIITISDDGMGIDIQSLKNKLRLKGIDVDRLEQKSLLEYIYEDSFSTSKHVSEISGRGVGLSAVKREVQNLEGTIELISKKDEGTVFKITVAYK